MTQFDFTTNPIFSATEREFFRPLAEASESRIVTLSIADIIDGLYADYESFSHGNEAGIRIPEKKQEPRLVHACILYAEGLRLAHTHLELAKKLILASFYDRNARAAEWLTLNGEAKQIEKLLKRIKDFENYKAEERRKEMEEAMRLKGQ